MQNEEKNEKAFSYKSCPLFPGPEYRTAFMTEVFELTYHGGGGFTYTEVWNMDVPKRRFNLKKINEHLDRIQQMRDEQQKKVDKNTDVNKLKLPDFVTNKPQDNAFVSKVKSKK